MFMVGSWEVGKGCETLIMHNVKLWCNVRGGWIIDEGNVTGMLSRRAHVDTTPTSSLPFSKVITIL
jgi:hypothetical protein